MSSGGNESKAASGLFVLVVVLSASLIGSFLLIKSFFPWMTVFNKSNNTDTSSAVVDKPVDVTDGGSTPAERVLKRVMRTDVSLPTGWNESDADTGVPGVSFGFGCDPKDGLAPVVAQQRQWSHTTLATGSSVSPSSSSNATAAVTGSLSVSARAYPAGGGAVAFTDLTQAVLACDSASLSSSSGVGVEVVEVVSGQGTSLVWRRGDVLMVGTVTGDGNLDEFMSVFQTFDAALAQQLNNTCLDPNSTSQQGVRSPFLNRKNYSGFYTSIPVHRKRVTGTLTAEQRTKQKIVSIPGRHITIPYIADRPEAPVPAVTTGPSVLPAPVDLPTEPAVPSETPTNTTDVSKQIDDPDGPGCGWAFTGQTAPNFDETAAGKTFDSAVGKAQTAMAASWEAWENAKFKYYAQYAGYVKSSRQYNQYANEVKVVADAWTVVENARDVYYSALDSYNAAVANLEQWKTDRRQARADYNAAKQACAVQATSTPTSTPTPTPTPTPTSNPTLITPTPTPTPTPTLVCPPARPAIFDSPRPTVPASPVPSPAAQLPTPKS